MEKIQFRDIHFNELYKLNHQGNIGTVYVHRKTNDCIKLLDKIPTEEKEQIYGKLLAMDGIEIDGVIFPKKIIMNGDKFEGYVMDYFEKSMPLFDYCFRKRYIPVSEILRSTKKASQILKNIHKEDIICLDLSFDNILINDDGEVRFVDMDSCCYQFYTSVYVSTFLKQYVLNFQKGKTIQITKNLDRISLTLCFYVTVYQTLLQKISKRQYNQLSRHVSTLENMKEYAFDLAQKTKIYSGGCPVLPEIPYLDELIHEEDDYVIDRKKQKGLFRF